MERPFDSRVVVPSIWAVVCVNTHREQRRALQHTVRQQLPKRLVPQGRSPRRDVAHRRNASHPFRSYSVFACWQAIAYPIALDMRFVGSRSPPCQSQGENSHLGWCVVRALPLITDPHATSPLSSRQVSMRVVYQSPAPCHAWRSGCRRKGFRLPVRWRPLRVSLSAGSGKQFRLRCQSRRVGSAWNREHDLGSPSRTSRSWPAGFGRARVRICRVERTRCLHAVQIFRTRRPPRRRRSEGRRTRNTEWSGTLRIEVWAMSPYIVVGRPRRPAEGAKGCSVTSACSGFHLSGSRTHSHDIPFPREEAR